MRASIRNIFFLWFTLTQTKIYACPTECRCDQFTTCQGGNYVNLPHDFPPNLVSLKWSNLQLNMLNSTGLLAKHRYPSLRILDLHNMSVSQVSSMPFQWTQLSQLFVSGCCFSKSVWPSFSMQTSHASKYRLLRVNMPCFFGQHYNLDAAALPSDINFLDLADSCLQSINANVWLNQTKLSAIRLDNNLFRELDLSTLKLSHSSRSRLQLRNLNHIQSVRMSAQHIFELDLRGSRIPLDRLNCSAVQLHVGHQPRIDIRLLLRHFCSRLEHLSVSFTTLSKYSHHVFLQECPSTARLFVLELNNIRGMRKFPNITSQFQLKSLEVTRSNLMDDAFEASGSNNTYLLNAAAVNLGANQLVRPNFQLTKDVMELSLAYNRLQHLHVSWLFKETAGRIMNKLNFSGNPMDQIFHYNYQSLQYPINVTKLILQNIASVRRKGEFPKHLFSKFSSVKELFLGENRLSNLNKILEDLQSLAYQDTLERLYLQKNEFTVLGPYQFKLLNKVKRLDISHNKIKVVDENAFTGIGSLVYVDLSGNQITTLVPLFSRLPSHIRTFRIISNPLNCECRLYFNSSSNFTASLQLQTIDAFCAVPSKASGLNYVKFISQMKSSICDDGHKNILLDYIDERWLQLLVIGFIGVLGVILFIASVVFIVHKRSQRFIYSSVHPSLVKKTVDSPNSLQMCNIQLREMHPRKCTPIGMPDVSV